MADLARVSSVRLPREPECPEAPADRAVVYLLDASTSLEDRLLRAWISRCGGPDPKILALAPSRIRRPSRRTDPRLAEILARPDGFWLVPLRIIWMPTERYGRRTASWVDVIKLGDPRDPRWFRDYLILRWFPDRVHLVVAAGAAAEELVEAYAASAEHRTLTEFVTRRAWRALSRAEREDRGNRYKIPRFVAEDIVSDPQFGARALELGRRRGLSDRAALTRAHHYLKEIAASHSPFLIDLIANFIHWIYRQGYGAIRYDRNEIARISRLGRDRPLVFLPSHRSNLDRLALQYMLWENDLPPNHTAGGINMNFFPVGPLIRRTGVFFIRRSFKDNELYKFVVKTYLDYLIERRFPLEWYLEGGRSRSGKLRPAKLGILAWVVDSFRRGKSDDIALLPISIAYDQIQDVDAYATEASGGAKEKESFSWALKFITSLRRRYGDIHISFAEPIYLAAELAGADLTDEDPIEIQKLAFEVMYRISSVTPITPTAVVSIVLLEAKGEGRDLSAIAGSCRQLTNFIQRRGLPTTTDLKLERWATVRQVIERMAEHGLVTSDTAGGRQIWWMEPPQMLRASYYRNMVVHFFVPRAFAEIALSAGDLTSFWERVMDLRDLMKFEFYFAGKEEFRESLRAELSEEHPDWEKSVESGEGFLVSLEPETASWAILPLLESYAIVADELIVLEGEVDDKNFLAACLDRGRVYRREGRIRSDEAVSQVLFQGALLLAANRGLLNPGIEAEARKEFAAQIWGYVAAGR